MKRDYRHTNTSVSMINYHLVFCPRYRRKIFLIDGVEARFKELIHQICEQKNYDIIALECNVDHCHIFINTLPTVSPHEAVKEIKGATSVVLREEFPKLSMMPSLWTRSYFACTAGEASSETIKQYIESQKKR